MAKKTVVPPLFIVVAVDSEGGFGKDGKIPWHFPEDFKHFKETTKNSVCIMGRKTYDDMLEMVLSRKKDDKEITEILPGRECYVVTSNKNHIAIGATPVTSIRDAVQHLEEDDKRKIFILGGEKMFIEALPFTNTIYMTVIKDSYDCDRFFPLKELTRCFDIVDGKENDDMYFVTYNRVRR